MSDQTRDGTYAFRGHLNGKGGPPGICLKSKMRGRWGIDETKGRAELEVDEAYCRLCMEGERLYWSRFVKI